VSRSLRSVVLDADDFDHQFILPMVSRLTIAFVGQCHTVGYPGVPPDSAFPRVCRDVLRAHRPEQDVEVALHPYYHPAELVATVRSALRQRPRVVVIEVVGWLAIAGTPAVDLSRLPRGVRSTYERLRHFRNVSRTVVRNVGAGPDLIYHAQTTAVALSASVLKSILPRYPRPTVAEYEACVVGALELVRDAPGTHAVVQGPGAPNLAIDSRQLPVDAIERYRAVNAMARLAADTGGALYVDRWDTVSRGFFTTNSVRPTANGHSVWGHLLASHLLSADFV
jgi:hypothetical protein